MNVSGQAYFVINGYANRVEVIVKRDGKDVTLKVVLGTKPGD